MERQLGWGRWATLLGATVSAAGCVAPSSGASGQFPGEANSEDRYVGVSRFEAVPDLDRESARLAKTGITEEVKPKPSERKRRGQGDRVQTPFPSAVGGFDWWQSMVQFRATCRGADGAAKRVGQNGSDCSLAPIDGLPVRVDLASGTFCEGRLCAMTLVFYRGELSETYGKVHDALVAKYGAPQATAPRENATACSVSREADDGVLYWFWETTALGFAVHCDENGPTVEVRYLTQEALKWGAEQNRRRQQSF